MWLTLMAAFVLSVQSAPPPHVVVETSAGICGTI